MTENTKNTMFNRITAICTIIIAITAVVFSIQQGCETRKHNQLTVAPILNFERHSSSEQLTRGITLKNSGFGPAIIKSFEIYVDGELIKDNNGIGGAWDETLSKLGFVSTRGLKFAGTTGEVSLLPKEEVKLLFMEKGKYTTPENLKHLDEAVKRLKIHILYESIYEQQFEALYKERKK